MGSILVAVIIFRSWIEELTLIDCFLLRRACVSDEVLR